MSVAEVFSLVISSLGKVGAGAQTTTNWLVRFIRASLREEILFFLFRLTVGLSLAVVLSFSLFIVSQTVVNELLAYEDGPLWIVIVFSLVAIICGVTIYLLLFRGRREPETTPEQESLQLSARKLAVAFIDGLVEGARSSSANKNRRVDSRSSLP